MNKNTQELIQKMAGTKTAVSGGWTAAMLASSKGKPGLAGMKDRPGQTVGDRLRKAQAHAESHGSLTPAGFKMNKSPSMDEGAKKRYSDSIYEERSALGKEIDRRGRDMGSKTSGMRSIIDDIIKGAEQNTFGRPVSIQADTEWTHFDTAKTAGMLHALGEEGYSVKQASEYLGLTEAQIQHILVAVR